MMWGAGSPLAWLSAGPGNMNMSSMGSTEGPTGPAAPLPTPTAWDVVLCISGTLVSCENALVVAIIVGTPAFRAPMFLLVGSLAVADLLAGLGLVMHFAAVFCIGSAVMSLVLVGVLATAFTASIGSLLAITVDRYLSLYNALTYYSETTVTRTYVMLALVWGGALGLGLLPVLAWNCLDARAACGVVYPLSKNHLVVLAVAFFMVFGIMLQLYAQKPSPEKPRIPLLWGPTALWWPFLGNCSRVGRRNQAKQPQLHSSLVSSTIARAWGQVSPCGALQEAECEPTPEPSAIWGRVPSAIPIPVPDPTLNKKMIL
uniref:G-protein coupled receptors family 1 profile domain-containing protein n=1 Tax=Capra hircus TaxID=9925 RepID=A0A8C2NF86_CAPHI